MHGIGARINGIIGTMPMWKPKVAEGGDQPVFRAIVQALADDIAAGRLAIGTRLPPHRDLADELMIARGTVARAYREAEKLGLVRSEVGRGTHVRAPDAGERPYASLLEPPMVLGDLSTNLPLSGIDPDPAGVFKRLATRPDRRSLLRYLPPSGTRRHRMAGLAWLNRMGVDANVNTVVPCAGAQHALFVALSHLSARSRVLYVEELTYPGIHGIAEVLGLQLVPIAMDDEGLSPADLGRACRRHGPGTLYVMPTIHNPTGGVMSSARRAALADLARKEELFVIEDAANRMLVARPPPPLMKYAPERTFLVASVSKVLSAGLRVAFLVVPANDVSALVRRVWATQWMVGPIGTEIVAMWLEDGTVDETLVRKRKEAGRRQAVARRALGDRGVRAHPHALHVWLDLPKPWRSEQLAEEAARQNIVVTPSSAFWARQTPPPPAIRIALGGIDDLRELRRRLTKLHTIISG